MSLLEEIKRAINTPVDYKFIHSVASPVCKSMTYVLHESLPDKPSLEDVFTDLTPTDVAAEDEAAEDEPKTDEPATDERDEEE